LCSRASQVGNTDWSPSGSFISSALPSRPSPTARASGRLHLIFRGVYAVGHSEITQKARFLAAVLSVGPDALLSHRSAAILWGFWPGDPGDPGDPDDETTPVDVTVPRRIRQRDDGIRIHVVRRLATQDMTRRHRIPVTTAARTALDLIDVFSSDRALERAVHEAEAQRVLSHPQLQKQLARASGRRGAGRLARIVADGPAPTNSPLEDATLELLRRHGFPKPQCQARVLGYRVDFLFEQYKLIIETDGDQYHGTKFARKTDARKQAKLEAGGYRVARLTWDDVFKLEGQTVRRLRLAAARPAA
jgi:very-short-patch-repair endonuclease